MKEKLEIIEGREIYEAVDEELQYMTEEVAEIKEEKQVSLIN